MPVLSLGTQNGLLAGSLGDKTSLSHATAHAKRYGPATAFLTVTPDDISNPTSLRLSLTQKSNKDFPAVAEDGFFDAIHQNGDFTTQANLTVPLDYTNRVRLATGNAPAVARQFRTLVECIIQTFASCCFIVQSVVCLLCCFELTSTI